MIQTGDLVLELHPLMEVGSWERDWEPRKAHPSWQSDFLLPAKRGMKATVQIFLRKLYKCMGQRVLPR